jgi:hypothetical protein
MSGTDAELLQKLAASGSVAGALSTRGTRKQARRVAAKIELKNSQSLAVY